MHSNKHFDVNDSILQREEALKKSEQMLEEDALRFDAFLKENDEKVQDAIKKAEIEAKARQDKLLEIKRLNASAGVLRSELNKLEEQLEDCKRCVLNTLCNVYSLCTSVTLLWECARPRCRRNMQLSM